MSKPKKIKLSKLQLETLQWLYQGPQSMPSSYKPVKKLLALGFVTFKNGSWSSTYIITEKGKEYLENEK